MITQVLLIFVTAVSCISAEPVVEGTIVKDPTIFAYVVKIDIFVTIKETNRDKSFICAGVIVNPSVVLTAAHCIYDKSAKVTKILVTAGSIDLNDSGKTKKRLAKGYKVHEKYAESKTSCFKCEAQPNDIATIWLRTPLVLSDFVKLAQFPKKEPFVDHLMGLSVGWGVQEHGYVSDDLKRVIVKAITQKECVQKHNYYISENTFCGISIDGKSTPSVGDSGCPFISNDEVLGIYSFGKESSITRENGHKVPSIDPRKPLVYTDVFSYKKWIEKSAESTAPKNLCDFSKKFPRMCALP